jgi:hypothetical protein
MFTVVISFKGTKERVVLNNLNRVQVEKVEKNWEKNPRVSYVAVMDERF